jgi:tRNA modification GTPase
VRALAAVQHHVAQAGEQLQATPLLLELVAEELRQAQQALDGITGEFTADDLLGEIFSGFCIGK